MLGFEILGTEEFFVHNYETVTGEPELVYLVLILLAHETLDLNPGIGL